MEEDSKAMASAGSYGRRVHFKPRGKMDGKTLASIMNAAMSQAVQNFIQGGTLLGHFKAIATTEKGFVKISLIDPVIGAEAEDTVSSKDVGEGVINIMAAMAGRTDEEVKRAVENCISILARYLWIEENKHMTCANRILEPR